MLANDNDKLAAEIVQLASAVDTAMHRLLTQVRRFDERRGWRESGALSCAAWLCLRIGVLPHTANERVRVARALGGLPLIDAAFGRGDISYSKVRAVTRVALAKNEALLLELAQEHSAAELERLCRWRVDADGSVQEPPPERYVSRRTLADGRVRLEVVLQPDEAAEVFLAIDAAREALRSDSVPAGTEAGAADGLVHLARCFARGEGSSEKAGGRVNTHEVVVHLKQELLAPEGTLSASLEDGTPVPAETLRRIACDAALVPVLVDGDDRPLDVGRRVRAISAPLWRALRLRDGGCRFPGCHHQRFLHGHHVVHWAQGGATSLSNLVLLCSAHHRLLHEGGFSVAGSEGAFVFRDSLGRALLQAAAAAA